MSFRVITGLLGTVEVFTLLVLLDNCLKAGKRG